MAIRHKLVETRDERLESITHRDLVTVVRFTRVVAVLLLTLLVCLPSRPAARAVIIDSILVRVYDNAGVPSADLTDALKHSYEILRRADVTVDWAQCPAHRVGQVPAICDTPPGRNDMVVRLVQGAEKDRDRRPLGQPLLDPATGKGVFATVFMNRVDRLAEVAQYSRNTVLGRAIAHEIGHLILGSNSHSESGLMREVWTVEQLVKNRPEDWQFSPSQTAELRGAWLHGGSLAAKGNPGSKRPRT
jgi:hypothetical protein